MGNSTPTRRLAKWLPIIIALITAFSILYWTIWLPVLAARQCNRAGGEYVESIGGGSGGGICINKKYLIEVIK